MQIRISMRLDQKIASIETRKLIIVLIVSISNFVVFEIMSFLLGINAVSGFLLVAIVLYLHLKVKFSFIFDLNLKGAKSWERSTEFHKSHPSGVLTWFRIFGKALSLRFHYLYTWKHWRHFQNYLILPGILYWGIVALLFLNPFDFWRKQLIIIAGSLLLMVVIWFLKMIFTDYKKASVRLNYMMFSTTIITAFIAYSTSLGLSWYFGIESSLFVLFVGMVSFLLFYQSLFHSDLVTLQTIGLVLLGAVVISVSAFVVSELWTVNFYTAGLLLAGIAYSYWGMAMLHIQKKLFWRGAFELVLIFLVVLFFVLATTNFGARIG